MMKSSSVLSSVFWLLILVVLAVIAQFNYLLFHSLAEFFSILIALIIFMFVWNARGIIKNNYLLFVGISYFFIAVIDFFHTLSYSGMGVFPNYSADLPTQLWIAARYIESLSLLAAFIFFKRKLNAPLVFLLFAVFTIILTSAIFLSHFPSCFSLESGLTAFKKTSEYIISIFLFLAGLLLVKNRDKFDREVFWLILLSIGITILSELFFTFYISVFGLSNLAGHLLKVISFYLIYRAVIEIGLKRPYDLLFRELSKSEAELKKALANVKTFRGLVPICSSCKKIRDDKGYWNLIESYIQEHSEAEFTHSICPDCAQKLYPNMHFYNK